jgi:hypothetical protein
MKHLRVIGKGRIPQVADMGVLKNDKKPPVNATLTL